MPLCSWRAILLLTILSLIAAPAHAEEFLGIEGKSDAPAAQPAKPGDTAPRNASTGAPMLEGWHVSGSLGGGVSGFSLALTVSYFFNKYLSVDSTADYVRLDRRGEMSEQYGPEVAAVVRGTNPTIFTPFLGAGPGYTVWNRLQDGERYDHGQSPIASVFGGVNIRLMRNFGLSVQRRRTEYFRDPPITFADPERREPKSQTTDEIGFAVMF